MTQRKLTIGELMEGGLAMAFAKPLVIGCFVLADASMAFGFVWAEARYGLGLAAILGLGIVGHALISSLLILALGDRLADFLADPAELFVRLVFVVAGSFIVAAGTGLGALFFIVPGLYLLARWTIVSPLILLEGEGIRGALRRSWELTEVSVWALVAVSVMIYLPQALINFFASAEVGVQLTPALTFQLIVSSCFVAFEIAVTVFACLELSPPRDTLSDVFA